MSGSYVDNKVREALVASKGSRAAAQKILMAWAAEDPQLMLGIAQPFLKAIAAAAVERGIRRAGGGGGSPSRPQQGAPRAGGALSKDALARVLSQMGQEPPMAGGTAGGTAGGRAAPTPVRTAAVRDGGGAGHEKSMMAIAKAFAAKKIG
ncbi:hypothetical protein [Azospirillum sp. SYSU D00513]|uniref:hypothetical protein n=1 Tax=Azospirillum sp. SYSU D00513 TaxID=2812561 RepID=UPI001A9646FD|nr:hypothetical protein [Azospirillum sp. SYSU D00513]